MHAKGLELPGYEPRALPTYALSLAVCTRVACHNRAAAYDADLRSPGMVRSAQERVRATIDAEDYAIVWDSLVLCKFIRDCFEDFYAEAAALWTAVTGLPLAGGALRAAAQRTWERKRRINARQGWTEDADVLPPRLATPLFDGPYTGVFIDPRELAGARAVYESTRSQRSDKAAGVMSAR
jgi:aldehyde:ferredoxin oxidoreductase